MPKSEHQRTGPQSRIQNPKSKIPKFLLSAACGFWLVAAAFAQPAETGRFQIARLKYAGGGDWYNDPDAVPNLARFLNQTTNIRMSEDEAQVSLTDENLYDYPFLFMTGHGNVSFADEEVTRLRRFLEAGGFLYVDDDYGMDESFRREMRRVLPQNELIELEFGHRIYHLLYDFPAGPPKIHEHYEGAPRGYGIYVGGRLVVYYTYNSNVSDGWTTAHDDTEPVRQQALQMGANIVGYFLMN